MAKFSITFEDTAEGTVDITAGSAEGRKPLLVGADGTPMFTPTPAYHAYQCLCMALQALLAFQAGAGQPPAEGTESRLGNDTEAEVDVAGEDNPSDAPRLLPFRDPGQPQTIH